MKIVQFITRSDTIGGAQKYIIETSKKIKSDGADVIVIGGGRGKFSNAIEALKIHYISIDTVVRKFSFFNDVRSILVFRKVIKDITPDAIFIHSAKAGLIGRLALIGVRSNVIFIAHGWSHIRYSSSMYSFIFRILEKLLSYLCAKIVCISNADMKFALDTLHINSCKLELVPTGVIDPNAKPKNRISDTFNILTVTRFQEPKDFDTLLSALKNISNYDWELSVVGDGPSMDYYIDKVCKLGLSSKIKFLGFQSELGQYYASCDAVSLISKSEGLPLSLIEAMSYRCPLISSNVGGVPDLINDGINGFLIPPGDIEMLTSSLTRLIESKNDELNKMGKESYRIYQEKFNFDAMINKLNSLY